MAALAIEAIEETPALFVSEELGVLGERGDDEESERGVEDARDAFEDEDPAPRSNAVDAFHMANSVSEELYNR